MANVLDAMTIRFEGDINPLRDALRQAEQSVAQSSRGIEGSLGRIDGKIAQLRNVVLGYMSVDFAQHLYRQGRAAIDAAGGLGEMAESAGVAVKDLQLLIAAGATAGAKVEDITTGLGRFSKSLATAATQGGEMAKAFNKLGVATVATGGGVRDTMAVLLDTATALQKIESPAERVRQAMELFGRGGAKLLPILSQGQAGLEEFAKTAQKMGLILSDETVKAADEAADALALLDLKSERLNQRIASALMPTIVELTIKFKEWLAALVEGPTAIQRIEDRIQALTRDAEKLNRMTGLTGGNRGAIADLEEQRRRLSQTTGTKVVVDAPADPGRLAGRGDNDPIKKQIEALRDQAAVARLTDELDAKVLQSVLSAKRSAEGTAVPITPAEIKLIVDYTRLIDELTKARTREREGIKKFEDALDAEDAARGRAIVTSRAVIAQKYELDNAVSEEIERNKALIAAQQQSNEQYRIEATYQQLVAQYKRQNIPLTDENTAALRRQAAVLGQQANQLDEIKQRQDALRDAARDLASVIGTAFEDAVLKGGKLRDVMKGLFEDIQRIILRATITKPLSNMILGALEGTSLGGGAGIFGLLGLGGAATAGTGASGGSSNGGGIMGGLGSLLSLGSSASGLLSGGGILSSLGGFLGLGSGGGGSAGNLSGAALGEFQNMQLGTMGQVGSSLGGFGLGNALGAAGGIFGLYQASQAQSKLGGALGGAASGALLGSSIFPGIGTAIGAVAGGLFGGLMGGKPSVGPNGNANIGVTAGGFNIAAVGADNGFDPSGIIGGAQEVVDKLNALIGTQGVTFNPGAFNTSQVYGVSSMKGQTQGDFASIVQNFVRDGVIQADSRIIAGAINGKLEEAAAQVQADSRIIAGAINGKLEEAAAQVQAQGLVQSLSAVFQEASRAAEALDSVAAALTGAANALQLDQNLSPDKPETMLANARAQFESLRVRALGGDTEAASQLPGVGRALLAISQDYSGRASGAYGADYRNVQGELASIGGEFGARAGSARALASEAEAAANAALVATTLASVNDLAGQVSRLTTQLKALTENLR